MNKYKVNVITFSKTDVSSETKIILAPSAADALTMAKHNYALSPHSGIGGARIIGKIEVVDDQSKKPHGFIGSFSMPCKKCGKAHGNEIHHSKQNNM